MCSFWVSLTTSATDFTPEVGSLRKLTNVDLVTAATTLHFAAGSFLGLCNLLQHFVPNVSREAAPLNGKLWKGEPVDFRA